MINEHRSLGTQRSIVDIYYNVKQHKLQENVELCTFPQNLR